MSFELDFLLLSCEFDFFPLFCEYELLPFARVIGNAGHRVATASVKERTVRSLSIGNRCGKGNTLGLGKEQHWFLRSLLLNCFLFANPAV